MEKAIKLNNNCKFSPKEVEFSISSGNWSVEGCVKLDARQLVVGTQILTIFRQNKTSK